MKITRRSRSRRAYRSRKACRSLKAGRKACRSRKSYKMLGGISSDKTYNVILSDGTVLFEVDINDDDNALTIIRDHPSNRYKDAIIAGKYEINKINENSYAIIETGSMSDIDRRLDALRTSVD